MKILESFRDDVDFYLNHLSDDKFVINVFEDYVRIFKPISGTSYTYANLLTFNYDEISDEVERFITFINESEYSIEMIYIIEKWSGKVNRRIIDEIYALESRTISALVICVK